MRAQSPLIEGKKILTDARVVLYAGTIAVQGTAEAWVIASTATSAELSVS